MSHYSEQRAADREAEWSDACESKFGKPQPKPYVPTSWDKRWLDLVHLVSSWSKDRSTKVGSVIIDDRNTLVSMGWNGFPRGIDDAIEARHDRPAKYQWTEHAERNAIYNAAATGANVRGCKMYLAWYPCADCARAIIQSGITTVICVEPDWNHHKYGPDFHVTKEMLAEAGITAHFVEQKAPLDLTKDMQA